MYVLTTQNRLLLRSAASTAVQRVTAHIGGDQLDRGAYYRLFALLDLRIGIRSLVEYDRGWVGGKSNTERINMYKVLAFEKAVRLALNAKLFNHIASAQSANDANGQFQGAILVPAAIPEFGDMHLLLSVSGLRADGDECSGLLALKTLKWCAAPDLLNLARQTKNELYRELAGASVH